MMNEKQIRILLSDLRSVYAIGYFKDDLDSESEKWSQIEMLEHILSYQVDLK
jgi:hypothetical protein